MIAIPADTTVYAGGLTWRGEIPDELCPEHLKPTAAPVKRGKEADSAEPA